MLQCVEGPCKSGRRITELDATWCPESGGSRIVECSDEDTSTGVVERSRPGPLRPAPNARYAVARLAQAYDEKLRRVENVLRRFSKRIGAIDLLAIAEITSEAAHELRDRLCPHYRVHSLAGLYTQPDFHVAILYNPSVGFNAEDFLAVSNVPNATRPMATLDLKSDGDRIRFFICHWTARFNRITEKRRQTCALGLSSAVYEYLHPKQLEEDRHIVILGDLNEEPYGLVEDWLYAYRDSTPSLRREHYTDKDVQRTKLYNCSWRLLGEHHPHPRAAHERQMAGSYYWRENRTWHTFDQVIVSGSLLTKSPPYLEESSLHIVSHPDVIPSDLLGSDELPCKFDWNGGTPRGLSDHLPVCANIILKSEANNVAT